jgi:hypothetical protein
MTLTTLYGLVSLSRHFCCVCVAIADLNLNYRLRCRGRTHLRPVKDEQEVVAKMFIDLLPISSVIQPLLHSRLPSAGEMTGWMVPFG